MRLSTDGICQLIEVVAIYYRFFLLDLLSDSGNRAAIAKRKRGEWLRISEVEESSLAFVNYTRVAIIDHV